MIFSAIVLLVIVFIFSLMLMYELSQAFNRISAVEKEVKRLSLLASTHHAQKKPRTKK